MPARGLAAVAIVFAIAACSDPASPIATMSDDPSLVAGGGAAHFLGGKKKIDVRGKHGHGHDRDRDDHDKPECDDDGDRDHHDRWGKRDHHRHHSKWHKRHDAREGKRGHPSFQMQSYGGNDEHDEGCSGGGEEIPGTISGSVTNDGAPANGFPVFLLTPTGTAVVANTTTTANGTYSFTEVAPGDYLVCETDPFVEAWGYLGESTPGSGPSCPAGYAPFGYGLTLASGATADGNVFINFHLE